MLKSAPIHRSHTSLAIALALTPLSILAQSPSDGHLLSDRWTSTATDGGGISRGDAITLTWGFLQDGTSIAGNAGEPASNSSLLSFLDTNIGAGAGGTDLTNRPWFHIFDDTYNRWGELSALSFNYESNDGGATLSGSFNPGSLGTNADMRIGGHSIDGQAGSNTLAYNFFPNSGDQVIDTDNTTFFGTATSDYLGFRNVIAHEIGHGLGVSHLESSNAQFLMEPFISTAFDGPQHSDILAIHRGYGDKLETGSGNDIVANASALGNIASFGGIGLDGDNPVVSGADVDFISIDGSSDTDFYKITLVEDGDLVLNVASLGLQYQIQKQGNAASSENVDTSELNNLELALFSADGTTLLANANAAALGIDETITELNLAAGDYYVRVRGSDDRTQLYSLTSTFTPVPEPSSVALLGLGALALLTRRR